jgi:DNA primase catalytic core
MLASLQERLLEGIRALHTGEDWAESLQLAARLPGHSFANIILIAAQRPGATVVAGYEAWQARGRQVSSGEPGIQVLTEADQPPSGARTGPPQRGRHRVQGDMPDTTAVPRPNYVWDVSQTTGPPLPGEPLPSPATRPAPPGLWDALSWLARREGFAVEREYCGQDASVTIWSSRQIRVRPDLGDVAAAQALLHQLGHVLLHAGAPHPPGASTGGCRGIRKIEADSAGFLVSARLGLDVSGYSFPSPAIWAGTDPRARPEETIQAAGTRITAAAATISARLGTALPATPPQQAPPVPVPAPTPGRDTGTARQRATTAGTAAATIGGRAGNTPVAAPGPPVTAISRILLDAERFYLGDLDRSWVPGYLESRGFGPPTAAQWRIGYAPAGWTALTSHLRSLGHDDAAMEAAGLARRSSRGTLIDHFRDRVMLAICDEHETIAGFIGRARPDAAPAVPKYLNTPQTAAYTKGDLLFGLHEGRGQLASGAVPVIVEGPFDAIAVSAADPARHTGLAPCGTALTRNQVAALARVADLRQTGVLVALDGDRAGRDGALRAYEILLAHTSMPTAAILPAGSDPAKILQNSGAAALSNALQHAWPLARIVIDAHLDGWARQLDFVEGQLNAMRSAAALIARTLLPETASEILQITGGRSLAMLDAGLHPIDNPELPAIARAFTPAAICQIVQVADRTAYDCSDVTAEVANAVVRDAMTPKQAAARSLRDDQGRTGPAYGDVRPARLAQTSFPAPPRAAAPTGPQTIAWPASARREHPARRAAHR